MPFGRPPYRLASALAVATILAVSGCLSGETAKNKTSDPTDASNPAPTASTDYQENETLRQQGKGIIQGTVTDTYEAEIAGAYVALLKTNHFATTDNRGRFKFADLAPSTYTLRVDQRDFQPFEGPVSVVAGQVVTVNVTITPVAGSNATAYIGSAHRHDWWGDDTSYVILDRDIPTGPGGVCAGAVTFPCNGGAQFVDLYSSDNPNERPNNVWLGTGKMDIRVRVTKILQPFYVQVQGPKGSYQWAKNQYAITKEDQTISLGPLYDENNTDPAHFRSSGWKFRLWAYSPASAFLGPMHWTITIFRDPGREIPLDFPHPDHWQGATHKVLAEAHVPVDCAKPARAANPPTPCTGYGAGPVGPTLGGTYKIPENHTVTLDTHRMVVTLKWTNSETVLAHKPTIQFCAGDQECLYTSAVWRSAKVTKDAANERVFDFEVRPEWWDSPYLTKSRWAFRWNFDDPNEGTTGQEWGNMKGVLDWSIEIYKTGTNPPG